MARQNATNFTGPLQFPYATAGTDIFRKEDVQTLAQAVDQHDHSSGKGLVVNTASIPAGAINGSQITDATITSAKIADGTIVAADIADASITNAKLGPDVARDNLLTNGGFEIWQRGNGPFTANGTYSADRWLLFVGSGSTLSVSRGNVGSAGSFCATLTYTHSSPSQLYQVIAGADCRLQGLTVTFSMLVNANVASAASLQINSNGTGGGISNSAFHSGNSTYQRLSVTATIPGDATSVNFALTVQASGTFSLDQAILVVGSQAANYVPLHPADDLARCLRYYEPLGGGPPNGEYFTVLQAFSSTGANGSLRFKVPKAVTPTLTSINVANFACQPAGGGSLACSALAFNAPSVQGTGVTTTTASGLVAGNATMLSTSGAGGNILAEANP
jgi:hypothetical protein